MSCHEFHTTGTGKLLLFSLFLIIKFHYTLATTLRGKHFKVYCASLVVSQVIFGPKSSCSSAVSVCHFLGEVL